MSQKTTEPLLYDSVNVATFKTCDYLTSLELKQHITKLIQKQHNITNIATNLHKLILSCTTYICDSHTYF